MLDSSSLSLAEGAGSGTLWNSVWCLDSELLSRGRQAFARRLLGVDPTYFGTSRGVEDREGYLGSGLPGDRLQILQKKLGNPRGQTTPLELWVRQTSLT